MEHDEPDSLAGKTVKRANHALLKSSDLAADIGETVLETALWRRH